MTSKLFKHFDFDEIELLYGKNNAFTYFAYSFFMKRIWIVHCFSHRSFDCFLCFSCFFETRFRDRFLTAFFMEEGTKIISKIDPRGDPFGQKTSKRRVPPMPGSVLEPIFFGHLFFYVCWSTFGALLDNVEPFWLHLVLFWVHVGPFWINFGSFLDAPG